MAAGNAIRGVRVGSGPIRPDERCEPVPRRTVAYWCANGHQVEPLFAADVAPPATWECPHCGQPAGRDEQHPPGVARAVPYKSHLAYVKERRSEAEAAEILAEALRKLHQRRGE
ncbi:MAG: RNA polymerase-binding protein RbpA [Micromonosporaceae bacterium]|nr:RNA polymerase-binding protein RbpA [Micromonosporaceae bacterium]